jgi:hypothetical protein
MRFINQPIGGITAAITRVGAGEFPFEIRHRRQLGCIALLARLFEHWLPATAIESAFSNQRAKQNVPYSRANLNPAFGGLTAQLRFPILPESRLGFRSRGGELGRRPFRPLRTERLVRWFSQTRHHSPPAKQSTRRPLHVTAAPSRATHPWLQNAIHQCSDELDVKPRSVLSSSANYYYSRPATCIHYWPRQVGFSPFPQRCQAQPLIGFSSSSAEPQVLLLAN